MMKTLGFALLLLLPSICLGQSDAVALLTNNDGSSGSCVVVERSIRLSDGWLGLAVTANHVVDKQPPFKVTYFTGRRAMACTTVVADPQADLAVIRVWIPDEVEPVEVGSELPEGEVLLLGYPAAKPDFLRGTFLRRDGESIYLNVLNRPGFSGGGVFQGRKLLGCISGGWYWTKDEEGRQATWPAKATAGELIVKLLEKARSVPMPR